MYGLPIKIAIVKPVGDGCNMRCDYCFSGGGISKIDIMSTDIAKKIIDKLMSQEDVGKVNFIWHGGEPLLRGIAFFKEIFEYQKRYRINRRFDYVNAIQSNLTLFNDNWKKLFLDYGITVSTSLDGTEFMNDKHRRFANGSGSYNLVVERIKSAKKAGLLVNVLVVISKTNMNYPEEIFKMFNNLNIDEVCFLPCVSMKNTIVKHCSLDPGDYAKFLLPFFDLYINNQCSFKVREFDQFFLGSLNLCGGVCNFTGNCQNFVSINSRGDVYACDTVPEIDEYRFGNIVNQGLEVILNSMQRKNFIENTHHLSEECIRCDYRNVCNNGCYNMRVGGHYCFCQDRKKIYRYVLDTVRTVIKKGGVKL